MTVPSEDKIIALRATRRFDPEKMDRAQSFCLVAGRLGPIRDILYVHVRPCSNGFATQCAQYGEW
jgi:hypothetical protein